VRLDVVGVWVVARGVIGGYLVARGWPNRLKQPLGSSKPERAGREKKREREREGEKESP